MWTDAVYCYKCSVGHCVAVCLLDTAMSCAKTAELIEMPFGECTRVGSDPLSGRDDFGGCSSHYTVEAANTRSSTGLQTYPKGQRVTAKPWLQNGLARCGGDKCGSDAAFRQNSLTARSFSWRPIFDRR